MPDRQSREEPFGDEWLHDAAIVLDSFRDALYRDAGAFDVQSLKPLALFCDYLASEIRRAIGEDQ